MRILRVPAFVLLPILTVFSCADGGGGGSATVPANAVPVIVGFNGSVDTATFEAHGGVVTSINTPLRFVAGLMAPENVAALQAEPNVDYVEEDGVKELTGRVMALPALTQDLCDAGSFNSAVECVPWGVRHIGAE